MKEIIITSQAELDALPDGFDEYTVVKINSPTGLWVVVKKIPRNSSVEARENSSVEAWGNSSVEARENSSVEARENSSVVARENSSVEAWGNSSVVARENSSVEARENSSVVAWGNSSVVAWGNSSVVAWKNSSVVAWKNSSVEAWGNSSVEARENSSVEAWGNSSVEARENSSVEAWGNSSVEARENSSVEARENSSVVARGNSISRILSDGVKIKSGQQAVIICQDCNPQITGNGQIIRTTQFTHNINSFVEIYPETDGRITLYKSVRPDTHCDFRTGEIKYEGRVVCPDFDPDTSRQCGGGLHLSPKPYLAKQYNAGTILECRVPLKYTDDAGVEHDNIVVYGRDITKVRCREVEVVGVWEGK